MSGAIAEPRRVTVRDFRDRQATGERIVVVAAYDAPFARLADERGLQDMREPSRIAEVRSAVADARRAGRRAALGPAMGARHAGHLQHAAPAGGTRPLDNGRLGGR